jgi:4,4'-diaponeurosporenoate glycosyltransferase
VGSSLILLCVTFVLWATGFFLWPRLRGGKPDPTRAAPSAVCVIIPARNEEHNLPRLLGSLASQPVKPREVIVVDDGSTDQTARVARESGATVLPSQPLPEGWRGKTWACHQGAQAAKGELLLFVDADTWFEPNGLEQVLFTWQSRFSVRPAGRREAHTGAEPASSAEPGPSPCGAFSVGPYHAVRNLYEELSLFFNFNMIAGTVPDRLFGQMLLIDRESYWRVGGHEAVRGRTLENFFLARQFHAAGIPTHSVPGRGILAFRMYPNGLRELVEGWTKGFASGAGQTPRRVLFLIVLWMVGLMLAPIGCCVAGGSILWGAAYLSCAAQVAWFSRRIGSFRWVTALLFPVPLMFFFCVFALSVWRSGRQVTWKGREIRAD